MYLNEKVLPKETGVIPFLLEIFKYKGAMLLLLLNKNFDVSAA